MYFYDLRDFELPKDYCTYFWKLSFAILLFILPLLSLPALLFVFLFDKRNIDRISLKECLLMTFFGNIIFSVFGIVGYEFYSDFYHALMAFLIIIGILIFIILGAVGYMFVTSEELKESISDVVEDNLIYKKYKSFKEKNCPIIEWDK